MSFPCLELSLLGLICLPLCGNFMGRLWQVFTMPTVFPHHSLPGAAFFMRLHAWIFSQPLGPKIKTFNWEWPSYLNTRKSPVLKLWARANAFHPESRTSFSKFLVIWTSKVWPLRDSSLIVRPVCPLKCWTNLSGMICTKQGKAHSVRRQ